MKPQSARIHLRNLEEELLKTYGITRVELRDSKARPASTARQMLMVIGHKQLGLQQKDIASYLGIPDSRPVRTAMEFLPRKLDKSPTTRLVFDKLQAKYTFD